MYKTLILICFILSVNLAKADDQIIAVTGQGKIEVMPDIIHMELAIHKIEKKNVQLAKDYVDKLSSKAAHTLISLGVLPEDVSSEALEIETAYRYDDQGNEIPSGQLVRRNIEVTLRDITTYSKVVQSLVEIGVTDIVNVKPDISDYEKVEQQALAAAAAKAKQKAEFLTKQFDAKISGVHKIGDQKIYRQLGTVEEVIIEAESVSGYSSRSAIQYEFQPGPVDVKSSVYVEFKVK